jgi:hypothetical protein
MTTINSLDGGIETNVFMGTVIVFIKHLSFGTVFKILATSTHYSFFIFNSIYF